MPQQNFSSSTPQKVTIPPQTRVFAGYFSAVLLLFIGGTIAWTIWRPGGVTALVDINVLCFAAASIVCTLFQIACPQSFPPLQCIKMSWSFAQLAVGLASAALGVLSVFFVTSDLMQIGHEPITPLFWYALAATAIAIALFLWDRTSPNPFFVLYVLGLIALGMEWDYWQEPPRMMCWRAGADAAEFILIAAIIGYLLPKIRWICTRLQIPDYPERWPARWFMRSQMFAASAVAALNVWIALDFGFDGLGKGIALFGMSGRLLGITNILMILGASIVMAWQASHKWRIRWQYASFITGLLFLCTLRWAGINPTQPNLWLHRTIVLLISSAMLTLLCSFGLRKVISKQSDWIPAGRRMIPYFAGLAIFALFLVLIQAVHRLM
jgi:hypothetical protein